MSSKIKVLIFHPSALVGAERKGNRIHFRPVESGKLFLNPADPEDLKVMVAAGVDPEKIVREILEETLVDDEPVGPGNALYVDTVSLRAQAARRAEVGICLIVPLGTPMIATGEEPPHCLPISHPGEIKLILDTQRQPVS